MRKEIKKSKLRPSDILKNFRVLLISFLLALLLFSGFFYVATYFNLRALPSSYINDIFIGLKNDKEIKDLLNIALNEKLQSKIYIRYGSVFLEKQLIDSGIKIDIDKTISRIFGYWKNLSFAGKSEALFKGFRGNRLSYKLETSFDQDQFSKFLENFRSIEKPAIDYAISFKGGTFEVANGRNGLNVNEASLKNNIRESFFNNSKTIEISLQDTVPDIVETQINQAKVKAGKLLNLAPINLVYNNRIWNMDLGDLGNFLLFKKDNLNGKYFINVDLDKDKIESYLAILSPQINQTEVNATLGYDKDDKVIVLKDGAPGYLLDLNENRDIVYDALIEGRPKIDLKITETLPAVSKNSLQDLGIEKLLGIGETNFSGSPGSRIYNITIGANKFNKTLVGPGEIFSFNKLLGNVDESSGYKSELIIKDNKIYPAYGGGLCQVSTTLFRAVVNSGLRVIERSPHSIVVRYYNPIGFDAAIYPPSPDLKFINTTVGYIYIESRIKDHNLIFEIYGKDEGKVVKIIGPTILEKGEDFAYKTTLTQEVWQNDKLFFKKIFLSAYKPLKLYEVLKNPLE